MAIKHNEKWSGEKRALKKIQMHFVFKEHLNKRIRHEAADENINPSDVIRKIAGLPYQRIQRPRIGLSFNQQDLEYLAERYGMDSSDEKGIKQRVSEEVDFYYKSK
ncbi:MAG: hypothetical protein KUG72_03315 [Pseudomonadales bacterium]|nr:hypothetical protein [Pseudomonadales bacterium]